MSSIKFFQTPLSYRNNNVVAYYRLQIERQKQLLGFVKSVLPEMLAERLICCLIKDNRLLLYTDAAVWASQLRFYQKRLLKEMVTYADGPVDEIRVKLLTGLQHGQLKPAKNAKIPSTETINFIRNQGLQVSDKSLQQALLRLSETLRRRATPTSCR